MKDYIFYTNTMKRMISFVLYIFMWGLSVFPQTKYYSFKLEDKQNGDSLTYASIISSSGIYTLSNNEGRFIIRAAENDTITIRHIGYRTLKTVYSELPGVIKMEPLSNTLGEVAVISSADNILEAVIKQLKKDRKKGRNKTQQYFCRTTEQGDNFQVMSETFIEANSAVSLEDITILGGKRNYNGLDKRGFPNKTSMHTLLEISLDKMSSKAWKGMITPLHGKNYKKYFHTSCHLLEPKGERAMYIIDLKRKGENIIEEKGIVEGTLYVDAKTYRLVRFEGCVPYMAVITREFTKHIDAFDYVEGEGRSTAKNQFSILFSEHNGFAEISTIRYTVDGGYGKEKKHGECILTPIDHITLPIPKNEGEARRMGAMSEDVVDSILRVNNHVVERTKIEREIAKNEDKGNSMFQKLVQEKAENLQKFGNKFPQEKVFLHMDNTCYFLGDTIWFKAYTRQTDTGAPSGKSGVLYVELLNHDGYLMERKLIEMSQGEGHGFFHLKNDSSLYSGFYELRAYTRWQLNWGEYEHKKTQASRKWFFNKTMEYEFFRDYEKLYSRVFPVYDQPEEAGEYVLSMSERPKLRYYSMNPSEAEMTLSFFPEGGTLVEGVPCRVAFEASMTDGEYLEGGLTVEGKTVPVTDRGRGVFTVTPKAGERIKAVFRTKEGKEISKELPKAEAQGATLCVEERNGKWTIGVQASGGLSTGNMAMTLMHEGRMIHFAPLDGKAKAEIRLDSDTLKAGVHQATLYDADGRVWADRLFFVKKKDIERPTLTFNGAKEQYKPYEQISLGVQGVQGNTRISVAVRDAVRGSRNDDTGNILTEMLLASEIKGFVPQPEWYFEADDERHNRALDLLMMVQGWRRFDWKEMAVKGKFIPVHPVEKTPYIFGAVHTYEAAEKYSPLQETVLRDHLKFMGVSQEMINDDINRRFGWRDTDGSRFFAGKDLTSGNWEKHADTTGLDKEQYRRWKGDGEMLKNEIRVHGEVEYQGRTLKMDATADDGQFRFKTPKLYGDYQMFLWASDYSKWPDDEKKFNDHIWSKKSEYTYPEFYVRLSNPYPKFAKPYNHYQTAHRPLKVKEEGKNRPSLEKTLQEVKVYASHGGLRRDKYMRPVVALDAYDAFNLVVDAGLMDGWYSSFATLSQALAQYHVGHMGLEGHYNVVNRLDNIYGNTSTAFRINGMSVEEATKKFNRLTKLDSIYIFTDYSPRLEGDKRYYGSDRPAVSVLFKSGYTNAYSDRCIKMQGFAYPAECYSPDYSKQTPPDNAKDYRRTLYWNPNLMLDKDGKATITLYNNARTTEISVDAAGQAADGTLLWGDER